MPHKEYLKRIIAEISILETEIENNRNDFVKRTEALIKKERDLAEDIIKYDEAKISNKKNFETGVQFEKKDNQADGSLHIIEDWNRRHLTQQKEKQLEKLKLEQLQEEINKKNIDLNKLRLLRSRIEDEIKSDEDPSNFIVSKGQLTFDAEGQEGGPYHSRVPHVPSGNSGVTIGRGYDLKLKTKEIVIEDLTASGLIEKQAKSYAECVGLQGKKAQAYIDMHEDDLIEITSLQQKKLFEIIYDRFENDVIRLCNKADVVEKYGKTEWQKLNIKIKEILVDLHFRGDYDGRARKLIQKSVVSNDLKTFSKAISLKNNWPNVPPDRFDRRVSYLKNNILNLISSATTKAAFFSHITEHSQKKMDSQKISTSDINFNMRAKL